jgi:hypothetical protein
VVRVRTPLFQRGDAPSRGPHRSHESTEQATSTFIHQYVIYTQGVSRFYGKLLLWPMRFTKP